MHVTVTQSRIAAAVLLVFALVPATSVPADPPCPTGGYDGARCLADRGRQAAACAPRTVRPKLRSQLARVAREISRAGRWSDRGAPREADYHLGLATARLVALQGRIAALPAGGRLTEDCRDAMRGAVDTLSAAVAALGSDAPTTTTTVPVATTTIPGAVTTSVTTSTTSSTASTLPLCGNGQLDRGEQCDGTNVFGRTCVTLGFTGGTLACGPDCIFDVSHCR